MGQPQAVHSAASETATPGFTDQRHRCHEDVLCSQRSWRLVLNINPVINTAHNSIDVLLFVTGNNLPGIV